MVGPAQRRQRQGKERLAEFCQQMQAGPRLVGWRLQFGERQSSLRGSRWVVTLPADYEARSQALVRQQLARAGARLAQLLQTIWPDAAKP